MPPVQRTFQLIPEGSKPVSRPPMTSKAAKKAYLKANQGGPKVSRAEQRRLDREAVERLNKEHEREKAAAKAKAAREKKAAKANAEREERRRKGIPEPSRHVRASQPTISGFVRPGNKRMLDQMKDAEEDEDTLPEDTMAEDTALEPIVEELDHAVASKPVASTNMEHPAKRIAMDMSSDDEFGDFPSLSQSDIFQRMDSPMPSFQDKIVSKPAQKEASDPESDDFPTLSQCDLLEKGSLPLGATTISRSCTPNPQRPSTISPPPGREIQKPIGETEPLLETTKGNKILATVAAPQNTIYSQKSHINSRAISTVNMLPPKAVPSRYPLHGRSANTMPPPALTKSNKATSFPPAVSRFSAQQTPARGYETPVQNTAPTPTQAFLESNLDDFFPSPSQEIRELLDDVDDMPSNTQIAMELGPVKQKPKESNSPLRDLFPTPDFALSSQVMLDMDTPSRPPNQRIEPGRKDSGIVRQPLPRSSLGKETIANCPQIHPQQLIHQVKTHMRSESRSSSPKPPPIPPKTPLSPPPKRRFFQEKPEDQLHAVLWESKIEAQAAEKAHQQAQAQEKVRQLAQAQANAKKQALAHVKARQEAQLEVQATTLYVETSPPRNKRTFQRAQSSVTDYGDDEFSGCSQELLALC